MTQEQRQKIENAFYNHTENANTEWDKVVERTLIKFSFEREEQIIKMKFVERKQRYNICKELQIKKRQFYYYLNRIYDVAYLWAVELGLF